MLLQRLCPNPNDPNCVIRAMRTLPGPGQNIMPGDMRVNTRPIVVNGQNLNLLTLTMTLHNAGEHAVENPRVIVRPQDLSNELNANPYPAYVLSHSGAIAPGDTVSLEGAIHTEDAAVAVWVMVPAVAAPAAAKA
jgi:hypothetical protein